MVTNLTFRYIFNWVKKRNAMTIDGYHWFHWPVFFLFNVWIRWAWEPILIQLLNCFCYEEKETHSDWYSVQVHCVPWVGSKEFTAFTMRNHHFVYLSDDFYMKLVINDCQRRMNRKPRHLIIDPKNLHLRETIFCLCRDCI